MAARDSPVIPSSTRSKTVCYARDKKVSMDRETADDIKRHFNVVAEGLRSEIRTVAEGLDATNTRIDGILSRIAEEFRDMRAMIRLLFGDLDRRIRALE